MSGRQPIFLRPVLQEKIWGGDRLGSLFGYAIPSDHTGECWAISGHPSGDCPVSGPEYGGETLGSLWKTRPELFGGIQGDTFPLLIKIIDAKDDLSIQVHPDDEYARVHENGSLGKTECWYVLDCDPGATIIIGHNAADAREMADMVDQGGTLILETQQSSDVTYRFYDYGRLENGKPRALHIRQSLAVTRAPFQPHPIHRETVQEGGAQVTKLVACPYYTVYRAEVDGLWERDWNQPFVNVSVIGGEGLLDGRKVRKGDHLLLPAGYGKMALEGRLELICSHL